MGSSLREVLWRLSKAVVGEVKSYEDPSRPLKVKEIRLKWKVDLETFVYEKGVTRHGKTLDEHEADGIHWGHAFHFADKVVKQLPEYADTVAEVARLCGPPSLLAERWVSQFVYSVLDEAILRGASDRFLADRAQAFENDMAGGRADQSAEVWLHGVWLVDERYAIEPGTVLRRSTPSDLEDECAYFLLPAWLDRSSHLPPSAILECVSPKATREEAQLDVRKLLDVFLLFRVGSVVATRQTFSSNSVLNPTSESYTMSLPSVPHKYAFADCDVQPFRRFLSKMKPFLPVDRDEPVGIALDRYNDAVLHALSAEGRITSAVTCCEALCLKKNETTEAARKLSQRVSALLRVLGFDARKAYGELKEAYGVRSRFVHGSKTQKQRRKSLPTLCEAVLNYARVSLLAFIQLQGELSKDELINDLDASMLDDGPLQTLQQLSSKNLVVP